MPGQVAEIVRGAVELGGPRADLRGDPVGGRDAASHRSHVRTQPHPPAVCLTGTGHRLLHVGHGIRSRSWGEAEGRAAHLVHSIEPEGTPVLSPQVPGEQVPTPPRRDEPVGLDIALGGLPGAPGVAEAGSDPVPDGVGEGDEDTRVDVIRGAGQQRGRLGQRRGLRAQARRHDLIELRQGTHGRLSDGGDPLGADPQRDGHGDDLVLLEHERGRVSARAEAVPAADTGGRVDGVAELPQPLDVPAQGAGGHPEQLGQLRPGPHGPGLEEPQEPEHPSGRRGHDLIFAWIGDRKCPQAGSG